MISFRIHRCEEASQASIAEPYLHVEGKAVTPYEISSRRGYDIVGETTLDRVGQGNRADWGTTTNASAKHVHTR